MYLFRQAWAVFGGGDSLKLTKDLGKEAVGAEAALHRDLREVHITVGEQTLRPLHAAFHLVFLGGSCPCTS